MKKLFSHLLFVKIIEFRSFLENSPETALQFPLLLLRTSRTTKFRILELLVENGKPSPGEIRQEQDAWGGWEQLHVTHGCAEGEHKVVRKALNSSVTYKTGFYKDPSSLVPNCGEHVNVYSHALRIKVAQIKSFC